MKVVDAKTMRLVDETAIREYRIPGIVLMENAGSSASQIILKRYAPKRVSVFAGKGNNGGDGFVAARHLKNNGVETKVYLVAEELDVKGDARTNLDVWKAMGGEIYTIAAKTDIERIGLKIRHTDLIVDAIFGTGLEKEVTGIFREVIDFINSLDKKVVSIDVPTGLDGTTGRVIGSCIKADTTITMALPKIGLIIYPGADYAGNLEIVDIGIPANIIDEVDIKCETIERDFISATLKKRAKDSHKGTFGHLIVLAGSPGKTGAAALTSLSAMRVGTGLVTLGIPESLNNIMEEKLTEVMTEPLPETKAKTLGSMSFDRIKELSEDKDAIAIGPGLTTSSDIKELVIRLIKGIKIPMVIDADGLNVLSGCQDILKDANTPIILTPHPGEMARLVGISVKDVQSDRINTASRAAAENNVIVVLKGARTVIAEPSGRVYINMTGNSGMATAGTGDVLTGMLAGFIAQGYSPIDAARLGVYLHGFAGDKAAEKIGKIGMMAGDILNLIPTALNSFYCER